ncbi:MAG: alpha/beta hydrolase [Candidatus Thorarchaeota archaeon]
MKIKRILRYILLLLCYICIGLFGFITVLYLFFETSSLGWIIALVYPSVAPLLFLLVLTSGLIIIRFSFMGKRREMSIIALICTFIFIGAVIPYPAVPFGIAEAENQMLSNYGRSYANLDTSSMRPAPYSVFDSLFGISIDRTEFSVQYDIPYMDNGQDTLRFDWYCPEGKGPFPVIIAIHGGAWVLGDKGSANIPVFNQYFASKGYVVFDIQYGLFDVSSLPDSFGAFTSLPQFGPSYNGSYTIEDQIENVGYFTKMLETNSSKYNADMDNVFVVGRSAGGNLASLVTLGYKNPLFAGNFSSTMTVRGGIWIYPVTNITRDEAGFFDPLVEGSLPIEDQYKKLFAASLILNSTIVPPIMIVHGSKDGLADYQSQGVSFHKLAKNLGHKCLLITIPWAGHGFDYNFYGYGGQISTYYIERFIALELEGR